MAQNALHYVPTLDLRRVAAQLRGVFAAGDRCEAEERLARLVAEHRQSAPKLAAWLETNVPESFAVFAVPETHRRRMRTTNRLERVNQEIKRRTRVAMLFPNEASLLRLVIAVLEPFSKASSAIAENRVRRGESGEDLSWMLIRGICVRGSWRIATAE